MDGKEAVVSFDPLVATPDDPEMVRLRTDEIVTRTPTACGPVPLRRRARRHQEHRDVQRELPRARVVVPDEEQFINEIPEPRHGTRN